MVSGATITNVRGSEVVSEAEAVCRRAARESQKCAKCANSRWLTRYVNSARFQARVNNNAGGLGVCVRDADNVFGIAAADTARSVGCDAWEPAD